MDNTQEGCREEDFDIEKVNALPKFRPEDYLQSVNDVAFYAKEFLADGITDSERRIALEVISRAKSDEREPSTEALLKMIGENTGKRINLGLDDLDQYLSVARAAIALVRK